MSSVYGNPSEYGLRLIGSVDMGSYEWCKLAAFQRISDEVVVWANDSGCSCTYFLEGSDVEGLVPLSADYAAVWRKWYRDSTGTYGGFSDERDALEKLIRDVGKILSDQRRTSLRKVASHDA